MLVTSAADGGRPLQYFIHDDFDALRMELSGSLAGRAAQRAYELWRRTASMLQRRPMVIDISYIIGADEDGRAVLRAWHRHGARIVAASGTSRAIATSALGASGPEPQRRRTALRRLASLFARPIAGNPAHADGARLVSAAAKWNNAENAGLPAHGKTEQQVP